VITLGAGTPGLAAASATLGASAAAAQLAHAIDAARSRGHSWRTIAKATGMPHQSLHRRAQRKGAG
jgi:hypothetical protein